MVKDKLVSDSKNKIYASNGVRKAPLLKAALSLILLSVLAACVGGAGQHGSVGKHAAVVSNGEHSGAKGGATDAASEAAQNANQKLLEEIKLPNRELDAALLEQLLISNLASHVSDWPLASTNALAAAKASNDPRLAKLAALLALQANNYQQAIDAASLWVDLHEGDKDAQVTLLLGQLGAGDDVAAFRGFAKSKSDAAIDDYIREVSGILIQQSNDRSAISVMQQFLQAYPESAQVALSAAYVAEHFKQDKLAQAWVDQALALQPGWDPAAQIKASVLQRIGESERRSAFINSFVAQYPSAIGMRINLAAELARAEKYQEALTLMQAVVTDAPKNTAALAYTAALARQVDNLPLAKKYYQKALDINSSNDEVRWALARFAVEQEDYPRAERHYKEMRSEQYYFRAQLQIANMRYFTRGLDAAIQTLLAVQPKTEEEYVARATTRHYLLLQDYQYEEAFASINEAIAYLPNNTELVYARALVAAEIKQLQIAEQDLRWIIQQQPDHANALNALGYTLADQTERYSEAKDLVLNALELRPDDAHILDSMGWVMFRLQQFDEAKAYLQRAYKLSPEVEVAAHLGEVLWQKGELEQAREVWLEGMLKDANNPTLTETLKRYGVELQKP